MKKSFIILGVLFTVIATATTADAAVFSYDAGALSLRIPPSSTAGTTVATMNVADTANITDLNVFVHLTHTFMADLDIFLGHNGTTVQLFNQHGGGSNNMTNVLFDDEASVFINAGSPPYGPNSFRPTSAPQSGYSSLLSSFDGMSLAGDWTLTIVDNYYLDAGRLHTFRLEGTNDFVPGDDPGQLLPGVPSTATPEPGTLLLFGTGVLGFAFSRRKA